MTDTATPPDHILAYKVTFGECDPAGIVYYPNIYAWFDRAFHAWLEPHGGHAGLCGKLSAIGLGLMETNARYLRPMRPGDAIEIHLRVTDWGRKALHLGFQVVRDGAVIVEGREVRGMFKPGPDGLRAGNMAELRALIGA